MDVNNSNCSCSDLYNYNPSYSDIKRLLPVIPVMVEEHDLELSGAHRQVIVAVVEVGAPYVETFAIVRELVAQATSPPEAP